MGLYLFQIEDWQFLTDEPKILKSGEFEFAGENSAIARREYDGKVFLIHKYEDEYSETGFSYGIHINEQPICGTGSYSLGKAMSWVDNYIHMTHDKSYMSYIESELSQITRSAATVRAILDQTKPYPPERD